MKISLSFDVEPDLHTKEFKGITDGMKEITRILDKNKIKATFFTTCDCIENYPKTFKKLQKQGHEIALHGYRHERFDDLNFKDKENSIKKSISIFKKHLNLKPLGFRAPQHSIDLDTIDLLKKYDFKYDSSYTPLNALQFVFFPKKFILNLKSFFSKPYKHNINGLLEIPPTSFLMPFVSLVFRAFPKTLQKAYFSLLNLFFKEVIFYAHSWDFIELPNSRIDKIFPYTKFIKNLDNFLLRSKKQNYEFVKVIDLI